MPTKSKHSYNKVPPPKLVKKQENMSSSQSITNHPQTASGLNQEAEDQFELELCWCIQQLQAGLTDMKLQDKQVYNLTKSLNVLKSNNASLIKKRQVMRNTFGDYRSKMAEDEKKFGKSSTLVKFIPCNTKKAEKKSCFFKKAHFLIEGQEKNEVCKIKDKQSSTILLTNNVSSEPFKFNFLHCES